MSKGREKKKRKNRENESMKQRRYARGSRPISRKLYQVALLECSTISLVLAPDGSGNRKSRTTFSFRADSATPDRCSSRVQVPRDRSSYAKLPSCRLYHSAFVYIYALFFVHPRNARSIRPFSGRGREFLFDVEVLSEEETFFPPLSSDLHRFC